MSISYHGVIGHTSKVTLPSVDTWGTNMNILRDPPRSIQTRKIDKVGETSEITQMIQNSGDRICEAICTYARGVNPMVSVSYDNYGNNGGQRSRGNDLNNNTGRGRQAYLPYRIMNGGAFRPPARDQRDLMPLSRQPRVATSSFTQPGFADFSKKIMCEGTDLNTVGVKKPGEMLKACIRPTAVFKLETPVIEPFEVRYVIKNPVQVSVNSGHKYIEQSNPRLSENPTSQIIENPLHANADTNLGSNTTRKENDMSNLNTERYTHNTLQGEMSTNLSSNIHVTPIEEVMGVEDYTKEQFNISYTPYKSTYTKNDYIHDDLELDRNIPQHEVYTNIAKNEYHQIVEPIQEREYTHNRPVTSAIPNLGTRDRQTIDNITNRDYNLRPTVNPGEYVPNIGVPTITRDNPFPEFDQERSEMRRRVYEMQQSRGDNRNLNLIPY